MRRGRRWRRRGARTDGRRADAAAAARAASCLLPQARGDTGGKKEVRRRRCYLAGAREVDHHRGEAAGHWVLVQLGSHIFQLDVACRGGGEGARAGGWAATCVGWGGGGGQSSTVVCSGWHECTSRLRLAGLVVRQSAGTWRASRGPGRQSGRLMWPGGRENPCMVGDVSAAPGCCCGGGGGGRRSGRLPICKFV